MMDIKDFYKQLPISIDNDSVVITSLDGYDLAAPESFWTFQDQDMSAAVNGCGPGNIGDFLIPDMIYGLSIKPACKIHELKWLRTRRILKYYKAVQDFGRLFFYDAHLDLYDNQNIYN